MACSSGWDRRGGCGRRCCSLGEATRGGRHGSEGAEWCGIARRLSREEKKWCLPRTDSATVTHRTATTGTARGGDVAASDQQLAGSVDSANASNSGGSDRG
jgi:hypothetical protein